MSYKTNPSFNRLKVIKGWKNPYFPTKTSNYARDISLWFKVYLLLKTFLNLKKIQLFSFEIRFDQQNKKILYLVINKKKTQRKKRRKKRVSLKKIKTPIQKRRNFGAIFFLFQNYNLLKKYSLWNQNVIQKKILSKFWLTKPKLLTWINILENIVKPRQNLKKKTLFLKKNQSFFPTQHLKFQVFTIKQKQILSQKMRIKKINHILYTKLFALFQQNKSKASLKLIENLEQKIQENKTKIEKINKVYRFMWLLNKDMSGNKKKSTFKLSTKNTWQRYRWNILIKKIKAQFSSLKRARVLKDRRINAVFNPNTILLLRSAIFQKPFEKRNRFLAKVLHLNFLIAQSQNKNRLWKNYLLFSNNKIGLKKVINKKKKAETKLFFLSTTQLNNLLKKKFSNIWKKKQLRYRFYQKAIWFLLRRKKKIKKHTFSNFNKNKNYVWKKKALNVYLKFLDKKKFNQKKMGRIFARQLIEINQYIKKNQVARNYQYRIPSRKIYFTFLQFTLQLRLKYLIQNFVQKYFSIPIEAKVLHFLNAYKNKNFFRLVFPVWRKKRKHMMKKFRQRSWKQKQIFLTTQLQLITSTKIKKKNKGKTSVFLNDIGRTLNKKTTYLLKRKKIKKSRIQNSFKRMKGSKNFRHSFKYFVPTLAYFSRTLDPQPLVELLAKVIYKAKKQTWMLGTVRDILRALRLGKNVGYKIALAGRINSSDKSRLIYITRKNVPLQVFDKNMNFAYAQAKARIGVFGIKIWIYF